MFNIGDRVMVIDGVGTFNGSHFTPNRTVGTELVITHISRHTDYRDQVKTVAWFSGAGPSGLGEWEYNLEPIGYTALKPFRISV